MYKKKNSFFHHPVESFFSRFSHQKGRRKLPINTNTEKEANLRKSPFWREIALCGLSALGRRIHIKGSSAKAP
jgi:hypothetical protein